MRQYTYPAALTRVAGVLPSTTWSNLPVRAMYSANSRAAFSSSAFVRRTTRDSPARNWLVPSMMIFSTCGRSASLRGAAVVPQAAATRSAARGRTPNGCIGLADGLDEVIGRVDVARLDNAIGAREVDHAS